MKTSVLLTWEIPENYNPAQPFTVRDYEKHLTCKCSNNTKWVEFFFHFIFLYYIISIINKHSFLKYAKGTVVNSLFSE